MKIFVPAALAAVTLSACLSACCSNNGTADGGTTGTTHASSGGSGSTSAGNSAGATGSSSGSSSGSSTGSSTHSSTGSTGGTATGTTGQGTTGSGSTGAGSSSGGNSGAASTGGTAHLLLVDNDSYPGSGSTDLSLPLFTGWLGAAGIAYATYEEPGVSPLDTTDVDPANPQLTGINTIVYFTGDQAGGNGLPTVSSAQQTLLQAWLDEGDKTLILFSTAMVYDFGVDDWSSPETNPFLLQYCGFQDDRENPQVLNATTAVDFAYNALNYSTVSGSSTVPAFQGKSWTVVNNSQTGSYVTNYETLINPVATNVDILATAPADPASTGTSTAEPVAVAHKNVGAKGTSTVVFVGTSVENITNDLPGQNLQCDFLSAIQSYANLGGTVGNCGITPPPLVDAGVPTLLVDNDAESNDLSLPIFQGWMTGLGGAFTTYTEPSSSPLDIIDVDPNAPELEGIKTIVWFTGDNAGGNGLPTVSDPQQALLADWLDQGGKTLVMLATALPYDFGANGWSSTETNSFLTNYLGFLNDRENFDVWSATGSTDVGINSTNSQIITGSTAITAFNGLQWTVVNNSQNSSYVSYYTSIVNPVSATNADVLATIQADPNDTGANTALPVAMANKNVGAAGTSKVIYVGFGVENISNTIPGFSTQAQFLAALASYAALP